MIHKSIELGEHAKIRAKEHRISEGLIREAFQSPDSITDGPRGRKQLIKKFWQRNKQFVLVIIYKECPRKNYVVTVWYTSKVKKYFKTS